MRALMTKSPTPISLQARDCAVSDCKLPEKQDIGFARRFNSNFLYQAATVAAVILVLLSI